MEPIAIDVRGLGKRYRVSGRDLWALRDASFTARRGEALGIIGPNGAGKSTLLKILSRITDPTEGRAEIRGRVASLLEVGTGFHPELTGLENVYLNAAILGMRKAEIDRQLDAIVAFADVGPFLDTPIKRYSSGMRVRLAFAVAAHIEPEILIVDEVLAVGDAAFQRKCLGAMSDVTRTGRTVLFVSHNMAAVQRLCSRALVLGGGRVVADEAPADAIARHLEASFDAEAGPVDLARRPRAEAGLGESVRLVRCEVLDAAGRPAAALRVGEPFGVRVALHADVATKDLSLVVGIDATDETRIATAASEESGRWFDAGPDAPAEVVATFRDLALRPGLYHLSLGVRHGQRGVDQVLRAAKLRVGDAHAEGATPSSGLAGWLRTQPEWRDADGEAEPA